MLTGMNKMLYQTFDTKGKIPQRNSYVRGLLCHASDKIPRTTFLQDTSGCGMFGVLQGFQEDNHSPTPLSN